MKRIFIFVCVFVLLVGSSFTVSASDAVVPYDNYTYVEEDASVILNPQAYLPEQVIYGNDWEIGKLCNPTDMDTDTNGDLYILDAGNSRVVVLDKNLGVKSSFKLNINDENNNPISTDNPRGITVTDSLVYICDTNKSRILIYNKDGSFYKTVNEPKSKLLGKDFMFQPTKVAVDNKGNLHIVSNGTYEGIVNMRESGEFVGFFSSNKVTSSPWDLFWRKFSSKKQRKTMEQLVPQDFSSIDLDAEGFFLITTYTQQNNSMVKKVNQGGVNVIRTKSNIPIVGDPVKVRNGTLAGNSSFIDVSSGPYKIYACLDRTRGRVFCYNNEGYLLYSFGTIANQVGGFKSPVAVSYLTDEAVGVLDTENSSITVFKPTEYGTTINKGVDRYNYLDYEAAAEYWEKVLVYNRNYQLAQDMIGRYYYNNQDYEVAMNYFKDTSNHEMYSLSKEALRSQWIYEHSWIIIAIVFVILAAFVGSGVATRVKKKKQSK